MAATRSGGCGSGKVDVGLLKWGLGYMGSLDEDRSSWRRVAWMMAEVDDGGGGLETCNGGAWR